MRFPVAAAFHPHAHHGTLEGHTMNNVPVYNVAIPLLARSFPGRPPFRIVEIPRHGEEELATSVNGHVGAGYSVRTDLLE
jgi:hypothetical protein